MQVNSRLWFLREHILGVIVGVPAPAATWLSVARRVLVVCGFFVVGLLTHNLAMWVLCCFGAMQLGLTEAVVPLRKLAPMLGLTIVAVTAAAFVAMCLGSTWWSVALVAGLAFAYGCCERIGGAAAVASLGAVALGVILSGSPRPPGQAALAAAAVAFGMAVQATAWVVMSSHERRATVRRSIALTVRAVANVLDRQSVHTTSMLAFHDAEEQMHLTVNQSGLTGQELVACQQSAFEAISMSRAVISWMHLRSPGATDRLAVNMHLRRSARVLLGIGKLANLPQNLAGDPNWVSTQAVVGQVRQLDASVHSLLQDTTTSPLPERREIGEVSTASARHVGLSRINRLTLVPTSAFRGGIRMALGVGLAQALSIVIPHAHSFWLPLTVVFTLKADWSFTVIRGLTRTLGNLAAVMVLPALLAAFGATDASFLILLLGLGTVAFRWFSGNYIWASFGIAGTVLILDYSLRPQPGLFTTRIVATILGAFLSLAIALLISARASEDALTTVNRLVSALNAWASAVRSSLNQEAPSTAQLESDLMSSRAALLDAERVASSAILELRPAQDPVALALIFATAVRLHGTLLALSSSLSMGIHAREHSSDKPELQALSMEFVRLNERQRDFELAVNRLKAG